MEYCINEAFFVNDASEMAILSQSENVTKIWSIVKGSIEFSKLTNFFRHNSSLEVLDFHYLENFYASQRFDYSRSDEFKTL